MGETWGSQGNKRIHNNADLHPSAMGQKQPWQMFNIIIIVIIDIIIIIIS